MKPPPLCPTELRRLAIRVAGVVQGVGFRPFVYNAARSEGLSGWVANQADTVLVEVQGPAERLERFLNVLRTAPPPQARVERLEVQTVAVQPGPAEPFAIRASSVGQPRPATPADLATCAECLAEIRTPGERRYRYPFTNCTNCGPRWSIVEGLPYDRPRTSMAGFAMCADCRAEYEQPADRRFHAQPIACPSCGPQLTLLDGTGAEIAQRDDALRRTAAALRDGRIVAIKGLGGFQLLVDATNAAAVERLRKRKRRPDRPLAVMMTDLAAAEHYCQVSADEAAALRSHQAPILLLRRREDAPPLAPGVAPGNPYLGVMLPYTPLHWLLMDDVGRPLVCTSGNLSEEPMATRLDDALERLGPIADLVLTHDRPIVRPVDDSVARVGPTGLELLRRARGFAPLPLALGEPAPVILALGGHLKNTVALTVGGQVVISPHIGDLDSVLSVEVHERAVQDLLDFFQVTPELIACDLHPDYASTRHAERLAARYGVPLVRVQHHEAHAAACMAEHGLRGPLVAFAWDGTGYGTDGTVWGGEAFSCADGDVFTRIAHLRPFSLVGGDRAMREPRCSALGVLFEIDRELAAREAEIPLTPAPLPKGERGDRGAAVSHGEREIALLVQLLARGVNCARTTSMGRLFDAVAALCGLPAVISFEGQAAMALEYAADAQCREAYPFPLSERMPAVADWEPAVRRVLADRAAGVPVAIIAARFHNALAELAVAIARRMGLAAVALSGGCFQNLLLSTRVRERLLGAGLQVYRHRQVPPGDGGLALGQTLVAARRGRGATHVPGHTG